MEPMENPSPVPAVLTSLVRSGLGALGGYLVGKGYVDAATGTAIVGISTIVATTIWGIVSKILANEKLRAAIAAPAGAAQ